MSESNNIVYVNNEPFEFESGEMVLSLLKRNMGPDPVPTLCDAPNLDPFGSCRVCSVEVALEKDGTTRVQASVTLRSRQARIFTLIPTKWSDCARTSLSLF